MAGTTLGAILAMGLAIAPWNQPDPWRLWARVHTRSGEVHEGYVRWDVNETSPADVLDAVRVIPMEVLDEAERLDPELAERRRRARSIVAFGVRITWDEDDQTGAPEVASPIRFGHIARIESIGDRSARLVLQDGEAVEVLGRTTDLGPALREIRVERSGQEVTVEWEELDRVDFFTPPPDAGEPASTRLHGTVLTWSGQEITGFIAWDRDEVFTEEALDGRDGSTELAIPFAEIDRIEWESERSARVVLRSGEERVLRGTNDVDRRNRGIEVSVPRIGRAVVPWEDFREVRFHRPDPASAWTGGRASDRLVGSVEALDGRVVEGEIRWDDDEDRRWQMLDGWSGDTEWDIEFGAIRSIQRDDDGVAVTLLDGSTLRMDGADDLGEGMRNVYVKPEGRPRRAIRWGDVQRVVFGR